MHNLAVQGQWAKSAKKRPAMGILGINGVIKGIQQAIQPGMPPAISFLCLLVGLLACLFACPDPASAEIHEYGPKYQRYALDLPPAWEKTARTGSDGSLMVQSPDKKSVICVRVCPREGRSAKALARQAAGSLSVSSMVRRDDSAWILYVTSENIRLSNIIQTMDEGVLVITVSGENEQTEAILASLHPAKEKSR